MAGDWAHGQRRRRGTGGRIMGVKRAKPFSGGSGGQSPGGATGSDKLGRADGAASYGEQGRPFYRIRTDGAILRPYDPAASGGAGAALPGQLRPQGRWWGGQDKRRNRRGQAAGPVLLYRISWAPTRALRRAGAARVGCCTSGSAGRSGWAGRPFAERRRSRSGALLLSCSAPAPVPGHRLAEALSSKG